MHRLAKPYHGRGDHGGRPVTWPIRLALSFASRVLKTPLVALHLAVNPRRSQALSGTLPSIRRRPLDPPLLSIGPTQLQLLFHRLQLILYILLSRNLL